MRRSGSFVRHPVLNRSQDNRDLVSLVHFVQYFRRLFIPADPWRADNVDFQDMLSVRKRITVSPFEASWGKALVASRKAWLQPGFMLSCNSTMIISTLPIHFAEFSKTSFSE